MPENPDRTGRGAGRVRPDADRRRRLSPVPRPGEMGRGRWMRAVRTCQVAGGTWREAPRADRFDLAAPRAHRRARGRGRADGRSRMDGLPQADRNRGQDGRGGTYGLTVSIHAHAGGFIDFEPELERLLDEIDPALLKICFDTGHHSYAGFDPVAFMRRHMRPHQLRAFQGHRPGRETRCRRQPHRFLQGLRSGHLLQPRPGRCRFSGRPAGAAGCRLRRLVHGRTGLRPDAGRLAHRRCAREPRLSSIHRLSHRECRQWQN